MSDEPNPQRREPPESLRLAGCTLWAAVLDDVAPALELDARELDTLRGACEMEDTIAALTEAIKRDGEVLDSKAGPKVNPAVTELRQCRLTKMRLLAAVETEDTSMRTPTSRRASHAANVRWDLESKRRGRGAA